MKQENEISVERQDDVTLFNVHVDLTSASEPLLKEAYQSIEVQGTSKILLRFDEDVYINSGGIMALSDIFLEAKRKNQKVAVTGLTSHLRKIFQMVGISKLAEVYDTRDEALAALNART